MSSVTANIIGDGTALSNLNASNIASGTLNNARLPASISVTNVAANGAGLTSVNLANTYGTVLNSQLPASISVTNVAANGAGLTSLNLANTYGSVLNSQLPSTISVSSVTANVIGDGTALSNLNASNIASGTLNNARLPASISVTNVAANGAGLTSLNLANTYGSVLNSQLPTNVSVGNVTASGNVSATYFLGNGSLLTGITSAATLVGDGVALSNLNASNIASGTLSNARLPTNISVGNVTASGTVTANNFAGNIDVGNVLVLVDSGGFFAANAGTAAQPGYSFDMNASTGIFANRSAVGFSSGGVQAAQISSTALTVTGNVVAPAFAFDASNRITTSSNALSFVAAGAERAQLSSTGLTVNGNVSAANFTGNIQLGAIQMTILDDGFFVANAGTKNIPGFAFTQDPSTGMYRSAPQTIGFVAGATEVAQVGAQGLIVKTGNVSLNSGILSLPTGVWHQSSDGKNRLYFATNGDTYYGSGINYIWYDGLGNVRQQLVCSDTTSGGTTEFRLRSPDNTRYFDILCYTNNVSYIDTGPAIGAYEFRIGGGGMLAIANTANYNGFQGITVVQGNAQKPGGGSWATYSDRRVKTNIEPANVDLCYDTVKKLPLQRFEFTPEYVANTQVQDTKVVGWIADDVERVFPKAVTYTKAMGYDDLRTLDADQLYRTMWGALTKVIDDKEIIEAKCATLEAKCATLVADVSAIKAQLNL